MMAGNNNWCSPYYLYFYSCPIKHKFWCILNIFFPSWLPSCNNSEMFCWSPLNYFVYLGGLDEVKSYLKLIRYCQVNFFANFMGIKEQSPSNIYTSFALTLSWWMRLSYRNQSIDLVCKSMDWFLYDINLRHERVNRRLRISTTFE